MENILLWILIGLVAGWCTTAWFPGEAPQGVINDFSVGIAGAVIGGALFKAGFELPAGAWMGNTSTALIGAVLLLVILRGFSSSPTTPRFRF
jgi:uncharacterized membrane protein YeaQ/YmgE (transglycosylase-associated protein family)